ncbi:MAG: type VI secretion system domain-containing protein, partial [Polyangiales bacterium]
SSSDTSSSSSSSSSGSSGGVEVPVATGLSDADNALTFHAQGMVQVAHVIRRENAMEALSYRVMRTASWLPVQGLPYADGITTMLPPPPLEMAATWDGLAEAESWTELLEAVETEVPNYLFWFDLHRRVAMALDRLGAEYKDARTALGKAVVSFITAFPAITKFAFSDGTPFVDPPTGEWLTGEQEKYGGGGGGPSKSALAVNAEEEELKKRMEEAKALVFGGNVPDGLSLATQLAMRAVDARTRFRSRITVAQMALDSGKKDIARAMLEALIVEADRHDLDSWEPALSVPLYANLLTCLRAGRGEGEFPPPEMQAREAFLFDKLCRLDPAAALKLAAPAGGQGG